MLFLSLFLAVAMSSHPHEDSNSTELDHFRSVLRDIQWDGNLLNNEGGEELEGSSIEGSLPDAVTLVDWTDATGSWASTSSYFALEPTEGQRLIAPAPPSDDDTKLVATTQSVTIESLSSPPLYWAFSGDLAAIGESRAVVSLRGLDEGGRILDEVQRSSTSQGIDRFFAAFPADPNLRSLEVVLAAQNTQGAAPQAAFDNLSLYAVTTHHMSLLGGFSQEVTGEAIRDDEELAALAVASLVADGQVAALARLATFGAAKGKNQWVFRLGLRQLEQSIGRNRNENPINLRDAAPPLQGSPSEAYSRFEAAANLLVSCIMVLIGSLWWFSRPKDAGPQLLVRYRAFGFFLLSWIAWALAWTALALKGSDPSIIQKRLVMLCGDTNAFFMLGMYFALTRGTDMPLWTIWRHILSVAGALAATLFGIYFLFDRWIAVAVLDDVWRMSSLCLAIIAPVLAGWGFRLRFGTRAIMVLGLAYGLAQPVIYATELPDLRSPQMTRVLREWKPAIVLTLACLKLAWAWWCTFLLHRGMMLDTRSIIRDDQKGRLNEARPALLKVIGNPTRWPSSLILLSAIVVTVFGLLCALAMNKRADILGSTLYGITTIITIGAAVDIYVRALWRAGGKTGSGPPG